MHSKTYTLNSVSGRVLKRSLSAHLMQVKLLLFTLYLNGGLHAVFIGKRNGCQIFGRFGLVKTESKQNFG